MDHVSICPFCFLQLPIAQLESHANSHFEDEQVEADLELAKEISLASSVSPFHSADTAVVFDERLSSRCEISIDCRGMNVDEKFLCLRDLQVKESFYEVNDGLIDLLRTRLELDYGYSTSLLSGCVDHIQSAKSEAAGWGCGWRNIQMLSSHLIKQRREAREVLFGGCGFVPDIASLQRWLELSWEKGFDTPGSEDFDRKIYGKRSWIGTTECATLFRSFGIRARIVDFCSKELASKTSFPHLSHGEGRIEVCTVNNKLQVNGPMDKYISRGDCSTSLAGSSGKWKPHLTNSGKLKGQHSLIDWVWSYFSDNRSIQLNKNQVIASEKPPLYFQHNGHSRTIVGIQATSQRKGGQQYNLLIFDPAHITQDLERSLKDRGWQALIKRGVHTLQKPHYQICYIDPGIAGAEEMEGLKTLTSVRFEY
ncbi:hypothetical protein DCAR_0311994 [Daucus carota subsp. sativus]|uniref:UFSP1/2/DUB catalytic domain-containing protein n=1 Tax=Daucus carota subsp. sativus TaxID=79200 RepID=A0A169W802_DAUCS|nr:PREDICTED: zinc finger with UFM1-specific peptidase domain protein [Daucus carota subsp. sativus]WOG92719.1 hypothetical protein DCAR_0311994 [Daucus carota subsp. sativus]